ncbi:site-2 protease family protein [Laceyella putida]|uniref:Site-2 protease family protein n=1 Tax=Laceyella putida TaxID=110101 RepID=A0ABW2RLN7_9BACL
MHLFSNFSQSLNQLPFLLTAILIGLTVHEFSHAYVATRFGDPTPRNDGRLTLNPAAHLDLFGTLFFIFFQFGWAKPVLVNRHYFRRPRLAGILVTFAGPLSNLIVAFLFLLLWMTTYNVGLLDGVSAQANYIVDSLFGKIVHVNVLLFFFNLYPLPPLDGYRIVEDLAPRRARAKMGQYEQWGIFVFLLLAITPLGRFVFGPMFTYAIPTTIEAMSHALSPLFA